MRRTRARTAQTLLALVVVAAATGCTVTSGSVVGPSAGPATWSGRLLDAAGRPVAGATVRATSAPVDSATDLTLQAQAAGGGDTATTGADGRFRISSTTGYGTEEVTATTSSGRSVTTYAAGGGGSLGDVRLWDADPSLDGSRPLARYRLGDAPSGTTQTTYGVAAGQTAAAGQQGELDLRTARLPASVVPADGTSDRPTALLLGVVSGRATRWTEPLTLPAYSGLGGTCRPVAGTGAVGSVTSCASVSAPAVLVDLGSAQPVAVVTASACPFSCEVATSTDGASFARLEDDLLGVTNPGGSAAIGGTPVTARYVAVGSSFAIGFLGNPSDPAFAVADDGPTSGVGVFPGPAVSTADVSAVLDQRHPLRVADTSRDTSAAGVTYSSESGRSGTHRTSVTLGILVLLVVGAVLVVAGPSATVRRRVTLPSWATLGPRPPSLGRAVAAHVGLFFALDAGAAIVGPLATANRAGAAAAGLVVAAAAGVVGEALRRRRRPLIDTLGDFATVYAVGSAVVSVGLLLGDHHLTPLWCELIALVAYAGLYVVRRSGWTLLAATASAVALLVTALALRQGSLPSPVYGGYLVVLGLLLAAGLRAGVVRPRSLGQVLVFALLAAGAGLSTAGGSGVGTLVLPTLFLLAVLAAARVGEERLLPALLVAGVLFVVGPVVSGVGARGFALGLVLVGALVVAAGCYLERVTAADVPARVGGSVAFGATFALLGAPFVLDGGPVLLSLTGLAGTALLVAAAASVRRTGPAVLGALEIVVLGTDRLGVGPGARVSSSLVVLAVGVTVVVVAVRGRAPRRPRVLGGPGTVPLGARPLGVAPAEGFARVIRAAAEQGLPVVRADGRTGSLLVGDLEVAVVPVPGGCSVTVGGAQDRTGAAQALLAAVDERAPSVG